MFNKKNFNGDCRSVEMSIHDDYKGTGRRSGFVCLCF